MKRGQVDKVVLCTPSACFGESERERKRERVRAKYALRDPKVTEVIL